MENQQLLKQLMANTGLNKEDALNALSVIAQYTREKFPILEGSINSYLKEEFKSAGPEVVSKLTGQDD